jgi:hypothetical protein
MVIMQDAAVTVLAIAGAAILARKIIGAMRPKADPKCEHCPTGAAAVAPRRGGPSLGERAGQAGPPAART